MCGSFCNLNRPEKSSSADGAVYSTPSRPFLHLPSTFISDSTSPQKSVPSIVTFGLHALFPGILKDVDWQYDGSGKHSTLD